MRTNYVLIDLENVRPQSFDLLNEDHFKVMVFVGANQAKVPFEFAESLQRLGDNAEYVRISGNGPNAVDFHIAYYIGRLSLEMPQAFFHIISKDTGFDVLISHLKSKNVYASRVKAIEDIPLLKATNKNTLAERVEVVLNRLIQMKSSKPRKVSTLSSTIGSLFQKQLSESEISALLEELERKGYLKFVDQKVAYKLERGS